MKKVLVYLFLIVGLAVSPDSYADLSPLEFTEEDGSPSTFPYQVKVSNTTLTENGDGTISISTGGGSTNSFETIAVPAGASVVADSSTDTLTITEDTFLTLTGTAATDTIAITQVTTDIGTDGLIASNAVALTTDTTGNYAAGDAEAGAALTGDSATSFFSSGQIEAARGGTGDDTSATTGIARVDSGDWTYSELSGDIVTSGSNATTIQANSVALTTDTTGNYAAGDAEAGNALTGDSATAFFSAGQIEAARGGTGQDFSGSTGSIRVSSGTFSANAETGTGNSVLATSPTIVTPSITTNATITGVQPALLLNTSVGNDVELSAYGGSLLVNDFSTGASMFRVEPASTFIVSGGLVLGDDGGVDSVGLRKTGVGDLSLEPHGGNIFFGNSTYDTANNRLGIGITSPEKPLHVATGSAGTDPAWSDVDVAIFEGKSGSNAVVQFFTDNNSTGNFAFSDPDGRNRGVIGYTHSSDSFAFATAGTNKLFIDVDGNIGIGTTSAGTSAAGIIGIANGTAPTTSPADIAQIWAQDTAAGQSNLYARNEDGKSEQLTGMMDRVSTQFDKTDTTLGNVTGLSHNVEAGKSYAFRAILHTTPDNMGGDKFAIGGTATATTIIYQITSIDNDTFAFAGLDRLTALGGTVEFTGFSEVYTTIEGLITVNAAGTLTVQYAQSAAVGTSSVLVGSTWELRPVGD